MKLLNMILVEAIRGGRVTVDIPGLDAGQLMEFLRSEAARTLEAVAGVACSEEMTAEEKVAVIQEMLV